MLNARGHTLYLINSRQIYLDLFCYFSLKLLVIFYYRKCTSVKINQNICCQFKQARSNENKKNTKKWPQGKTLHNELEIATAGNTVAAFPARAVNLHSNFSLKRRVELIYSIAKD